MAIPLEVKHTHVTKKIVESVNVKVDECLELQEVEELQVCAKIWTHFYELLYPRLVNNEVSNGDSWLSKSGVQGFLMEALNFDLVCAHVSTP